MIRFITSDVFEGLAQLADESVDCVVTSPPYWLLRDYGVEGQIGLEETPEEYVEKLTKIFREVRRVLKKEGTLWLNIGDCYSASGRGGNPDGSPYGKQATNRGSLVKGSRVRNLAPKSLVGIPWRTAFALQADGWILRQDIIWNKPACMPESVKDRCTRSHEYIFLLTKSPRYFFDAETIAEPLARPDEGTRKTPAVFGGRDKFSEARKQSRLHSGNEYKGTKTGKRNKRSVWTIKPHPFKEAHFAVFPPELPETCIKAGCPKGGTVLDPFAGAGTTGLVADRLQRDAILIELNPEYMEIAKRRIAQEQGMFADMEPAE